MATTYRSYEIEKEGEFFIWTDERGFVHNGRIDTKGGFATEEAAMDDIDAYRRNMRSTGVAR